MKGLRLYFPELEPWVARSASLPAVRQVYLCVNVGPRGATHCSACPVPRHSYIPAHSVYLCANVGPQGLLVLGLPASFIPHSASLGPATATGVLSTRCSSPPLLPVWMNVYFLFPWCRIPLPWILCQFWLCEEAQCVYLRRHLGSRHQ